MALFSLETGAVSSSASSISTLSSQVSQLSDSVSGYDTSCEDDFDFSSAKSVISNNLKACSTKLKNTSAILNCVVESHTKLQNSAKFSDPTVQSSDGDDSSDYDDYSGDGDYYGGGGGGYSGGGGGGGYSNGGGIDDSTLPMMGGVSTLLANQSDMAQMPSYLGTPIAEEDKEEEKSKQGEVQTVLNSVGYAYADKNHLDEDSNKFFNDSSFNYKDDGYGMIGDSYVVACDSSVGNVGDVISFKKDDGSVVNCVIGVNTFSSSYKNTISFIVDEKKSSSLKALDVTKTLLNNNKQIENCGNYKSYSGPATTISTDNAVVQTTNTNVETPAVSTDNNISTEITNSIDTNVSTEPTTTSTDIIDTNVDNNIDNSSLGEEV